MAHGSLLLSDENLDPITLNQIRLINNSYENLSPRSSRLMDQMIDPRRDVDKECGYIKTADIQAKDYKKLYDREPFATKVVDLLPKESWKIQPTVYEDKKSTRTTPFEIAWDNLPKTMRGKSWYQDEKGNSIWADFERADKCSRIGSYGVIVLGIDDDKRLEEPVDGFEPDGVAIGTDSQYFQSFPQRKKGKNKPAASDKSSPNLNLAPADDEDDDKKAPEGPDSDLKEPLDSEDSDPEKTVETERHLMYMKVYDESLAVITRWEVEPLHPRYNQPVMYQVTVADPNEAHAATGIANTTVNVHWTRVIHIADNRGTSDVFGIPAMRPCYNRLTNLYKIYGGNAEMVWRCAIPTLSFETHPQLGSDVRIDKEDMQQQIWRVANSLQKYFASEGLSVKSIAAVLADLSSNVDIELMAICALLDCPKRIFTGSERGELASSQDSIAWLERLIHRRQSYLTPYIIVPFVDRLIQMKVLPEPTGFSVEWPNSDVLQPKEKADVGLVITQTIVAALAGDLFTFMSPETFCTEILGYDEEKAEAIIESVIEFMKLSNPDVPEEEIVPGKNPEPPAPDLQFGPDGKPIDQATFGSPGPTTKVPKIPPKPAAKK